ncbi:MAG: hypothetical protein HY272_02925 [Gammaproteobacteria bacterium]|nr:hypothetical protein [Gammaproteobacteria bacterium]
MKYGTRNVMAYMLGAMLFMPAAPFAQQLSPPTPRQPASVLRPNPPVKTTEMVGTASIPEQVKLGFTLSVGQRIMPADWNVRGTITAMPSGKLLIKTDQNESATLAYRLPNELRLPLSVGDAIELKRAPKGYKATLGHELSIKRGEKTVAASGRLIGETPQQTKIGDNITLAQQAETQRTLAETAYETTYGLAATIAGADGTQKPLTSDEIQDITLGGTKYRVLIRINNKVVPSKKHAGIAEGGTYILEYVILAQ